MKKTTIFLLVTLLATGLLSCSDHRLGGPASPARLRLRSLQSTTQTGGTTFTYTYTYSYDSLNRPVSIDRINNGQTSLAIVAYGDPQLKYVNSVQETNRVFFLEYPNPADRTQGQATLYPLPLSPVSFTAKRYALLNSKVYYSIYDRTYQYNFNNTGNLIGFSDVGSSSPIDQNNYGYGYTGENISSEQFSTAAGHGFRGTITYTYDSRPNPFFELLDPKLSVAGRFSRNNVTSLTYSNVSNSLSNTTYTYEYNAQGLPTKRSATTNGAVIETLLYTYESY